MKENGRKNEDYEIIITFWRHGIRFKI